MSLSIKAVDRIFVRLLATYGSEFTSRYAGVPEADLKTAWAHELAGFASNLPSIAWALENLPERAPNVIQFRNLARQAPAAETPRLPEPKADPERLRAELAKLEPLRAAVRAGQFIDHRAWAHRLVGRHEAGERVNRTALGMARSALRLAPAEA